MSALQTKFFGEHNKVGFDLGQHSLKCAVVDERKRQIKHLWIDEIFPERKSRDQILNEEDFKNRLITFVEKYQKVFPEFKKNINAIIQGEETVCSYLELPVIHLSKTEESLAIQSQAIKYLHLPIEQVNLKYVFVPPLLAESKNKAVFFAAANKDPVEKFKTFFNSYGLDVQRLEIPVFPLVREFSINHNIPKDAFVALVHAGFRLTHVVIMRNGFPYYAREFSLAGRDFTYAFQMKSQITWNKAETEKLSYDTLTREPTIEPFTNRWLEEIKNTLHFFYEQFSDKKLKIQQIFLSGGTAAWKNLDRLLSEYLGIGVEVDRWIKIKEGRQNSEASACVYKIATGLSLE